MQKYIKAKLDPEYLALWEVSKTKSIDRKLKELLSNKVKLLRSDFAEKQASDPLADRQTRFGHAEGLWAKFQIKQLSQVIYNDKGPQDIDLGKWISVEIECIFRNDKVEAELVAWIRKNSYSKSITLKNDGSIHPDNVCECDEDDDCDCNSNSRKVGKEIVVTFKYGEWALLDGLCDKLSELRVSVNKTCGLHVHFDCRHLSQRQVSTLGNRVARTVPALKEILPKSRRDNKFCQETINSHRESNGYDARYAFVNLLAYKKHKTLEIRGHSGTIEAIKIKNWIKILRKIMDSRNTEVISGLSQMLNVFKFDKELVDYMTERYNKFLDAPSRSSRDDVAEDSGQVVVTVSAPVNTIDEIRAISGAFTVNNSRQTA